MAPNPNQGEFAIGDSSFLITGGTGSFGSTMVRKLLLEGARQVRVFSRDESKHFGLANEIQDSRVEYQIGDIRDSASLEYALRDIDYVFHAAALKHVPASESNPFEYVKTNIEGSHNLLSKLSRSNAKSAVFLSTDKSVYPVNAMGMSKALMEKLVRSSRYLGGAVPSITRYGNVVGSRGSIIPLLISHIKNDKPIQITDWTMTRFMMSLEESVSLVLFAMEKGEHGDLFVKKSPAADLRTILEAVELLLGTKAKKIQVVGPRPGEKIHETLLSSEERTFAQETSLFFRVPSVVLNSEDRTPPMGLRSEYRSDNTDMLSTDELVGILSKNEDILKLL